MQFSYTYFYSVQKQLDITEEKRVADELLKKLAKFEK